MWYRISLYSSNKVSLNKIIIYHKNVVTKPPSILTFFILSRNISLYICTVLVNIRNIYEKKYSHYGPIHFKVLKLWILFCSFTVFSSLSASVKAFTIVIITISWISQVCILLFSNAREFGTKVCQYGLMKDLVIKTQ